MHMPIVLPGHFIAIKRLFFGEEMCLYSSLRSRFICSFLTAPLFFIEPCIFESGFGAAIPCLFVATPKCDQSQVFLQLSFESLRGHPCGTRPYALFFSVLPPLLFAHHIVAACNCPLTCETLNGAILATLMPCSRIARYTVITAWIKFDRVYIYCTRISPHSPRFFSAYA